MSGHHSSNQSLYLPLSTTSVDQPISCVIRVTSEYSFDYVNVTTGKSVPAYPKS